MTGCMSLQDIADPGAVLLGAARVLKPRGRMVFSVPHPGTDTAVREWKRGGRGKKLALVLDRYLESGPTVCHWTMPHLKYLWSTPCKRRIRRRPKVLATSQ